jgi:uncharacterized protein (TIGR00661 family)
MPASSPPLRVVFFVQGEGRGHMTQSLAVKRLLEEAGHVVVGVFMGENPQRPIPAFVREALGDILVTYPAPAFVVDAKGKGVRPWATVLQTFRRIPLYWQTAGLIHQRMQSLAPGLIINFYDLLGGLYKSLYRPPAPVVAVAHQFLFFHPDFPVVRDRFWELLGVKWNTAFTALGASLRLALSFTPLPELPERGIRVVPPLLREAVLTAVPTPGDHILAYVLNPGYADELDQWHRDAPGVELHCFWDRTDVPDILTPRPGLILHRLDGKVFLDLLASCRGFISTAGFESVCEAAFLGKPVMVVPTGNHLEQRCNALDAQRAGIATWQDRFDLSAFTAELDRTDPGPRKAFRDWVLEARSIILPLLVGGHPGRHPQRRR